LLPRKPFLHLSLCLAACGVALFAQNPAENAKPSTAAAAEAPASWVETLANLPIFHWFAQEFRPEFSAPMPPSPRPAAPPAPNAPAQTAPVTQANTNLFSRFFSRSAPPEAACPVMPLPPITDPVAASFNEEQTLDTHDLTSGMARALVRFRSLVLSLGGSIELKSAYRPPAYQLHLQQVWDKWMQLRNNQMAGCQVLKAQVHDEFLRHHLLESQRPVSSSDHTRGLAFDATVVLPRNAHIRRRRVTLDALARLAGLRRPDILHDPVHFKYIGGRIVRG